MFSFIILLTVICVGQKTLFLFTLCNRIYHSPGSENIISRFNGILSEGRICHIRNVHGSGRGSRGYKATGNTDILKIHIFEALRTIMKMWEPK